MNQSPDPSGAGSRNPGGSQHRGSHLRLVHNAGRQSASDEHHWAQMIARRYGLTIAEARTELRRLASRGWQSWEFEERFAPERKDDIA